MERKRSIELVQLLLFTLCLCMNPKPGRRAQAAGVVRCIAREREALLKFKEGLIDKYGDLSSWGKDEGKRECCTWDGVTCSNKTSHVIILDVADTSLEGKFISPALLELHHLQYLSFKIDFRGIQIPEFIGHFKKLRHLDLSFSNFSGDVPYQLGNLTTLETLYLGNGFYNLRSENLEWLSHLSLLSKLGLSAVNLSRAYNWLQHIVKLPFLKELSLSNCQLTNTLPSFEILSNSSLQSLSVLDLSYNQLHSFGWLFNISKSFTFIDLSHNKLDGAVPPASGKSVFLDVFYLNDNLLHGGIPNSFTNLSHLFKLDLSQNKLSQAVPELFQSLPRKAVTLFLFDNRFFGPLPDITNFPFLEKLDLRNNMLSGFLPQNLIKQHSSLAELYLSDNQIAGSLPDLTVFSSLKILDLTGNKLKRLSESIGQLPKLAILNVGLNLLEGTITKVHFSNLVNLWYLDLSSNSLSFNFSSDWVSPFQLSMVFLQNCSLGPHFPEWLQTQKNVGYLDLSFNGISDTVPEWLWNTTSIYHLNLSHNHISDRLPYFFPRSCITIDLSDNRFTGIVPPLYQSSHVKWYLSKNKLSGSISHLCASPGLSVELIDFSDNNLSGKLPNCWMNIEGLKVLNLANNNFEGKIPESLGSFDHLETLHLRNNNFIGEIPSSLMNCTRLRMIDLGENKLRGIIPAWIGLYLKQLTVFSLRFNNFHGNISPKICKLTNILILDLSHNNISGKIPPCVNNFSALVKKNSSTEHLYVNGSSYIDNAFLHWKGQDSLYRQLGLLKSIDLSSNRLAGTIPHEICYLRGLISLNLSRNNLTGSIISSIGKMEMLESLDLSRNKLSGKIPTDLALLNFLSVLDLSDNNLTGKIPLSTQLQSMNASAYAGNKLCGAPLAECPRDASYSSTVDHGRTGNFEEDDGLINTREFYMSMALGFFPGFWAVVGTLFFVHSWRRPFSDSLATLEVGFM